MTFENPLPWWALVLIAAGAAVVAWMAYRRVPVSKVRRNSLVALRFLTLVLLVIFLMRPVARSTARDTRDVVVPVLVDVSRSMGIHDADGERRIDRVRSVLRDTLLPALAARFKVDVLTFGEDVLEADLGQLAPIARRSDVAAALEAIRERYRGRAVAGVVLLSDGGDTSSAGEQAAALGRPVFPIGVGSPVVGRDREVLSVTAAEAVPDDSRMELAVSAVSHGNGTAPIEFRLLENGRPIEVRRSAPVADGTPVREVFQVSPASGVPSVYTVEIPSNTLELVPENNARSVLVQPPSRARRVLLVEGAPGFEHSFLKRAWAGDKGLDIDSVVRKGMNEQGAETFYVQASRARSAALSAGYPQKREELFAYDALVLANVEAAQLTRAQLEATREFVGRRGGGLLVLGAHSFLRRGLVDTAIEEVLPLDLNDRARGVLPASGSSGANRVSLTAAGEAHPIMQIGAGAEESRKRWEIAPPLASIAPLGGPRPGATILALTSGAGGASRALVAVQRYGEGRSMIFTGEAAWRWRMLMPSTDRGYDTFWRQAVRWLAVPARDPVDIAAPAGGSPGDSVVLRIAARDGAFEPLRDSTVDVRLTAPDGRLDELRAGRDASSQDAQHVVARFRAEQPGVYRAVAEVRRSGQRIGSASTAFLVGGADLEMTDPRLNGQLLQRIAVASNGRVVAAGNASSVVDDLRTAAPAAMLSVRRDLWHNGWSFGAIVTLLAVEWVLRRRWGLR